MPILASPPGPPMPPAPVCRFTVDEYHQMIQGGILTEDDAVELLEGWIVHKMPRNPLHDVTIVLVPDVLRPSLPSGWRIRVQSAITTADSEPEPDFTIVLGPATRYTQRHPGPADIGTLIEVADTTLDRDRGQKAELFARAGIAVYWIINLIDRQVEVFTDPTGPGPSPCYRQRHDYREGDTVPLVIGGQNCGSIAVSDLLPPP